MKITSDDVLELNTVVLANIESTAGGRRKINWYAVTRQMNELEGTTTATSTYMNRWSKFYDPELYRSLRDYDNQHKKEARLGKKTKKYAKPRRTVTPATQLEFVLPVEKYDDPTINETYSKRIDGTTTRTKNICLGTNDIDDDRAVMTAFGLDPDRWIVLEMTNSKRNQSKDPDKFWYSCRIRTKPVPVTPLSPALVLEMIKDLCPVFEPVDIIRYEGHKAMQINIVDPHIGCFSWEPESGEMYDYAIVRQKFINMVGHAKALIEQERITKLYLCFLGDVLHVDNSAGTTTGGTSVDHDGRFKKMVDVGYEIILRLIDEFSFVQEIEVHWVEGNHSRDTEYTMFGALPHMFQKRTNITFNISKKSRTAFMFGTNLVGLIHGDMPNKQKSKWIQTEYRDWWANAKYVEIHEGHTHAEGKEVDVVGGITIRTCMTPKNTDKYEYINGWVGTPHGFMAFVWDAEYGLESIRYFR